MDELLQKLAADLPPAGGTEGPAAKDLLKTLEGRENVYLICGSPASGKTTYVRDHKGDNDLVIDLDQICAALQGETENMHLDHSPVLSTALEVRDLLYETISKRRGKWENAYVITTLSDEQKIRSLANDLRAQVKMMDVPLDECIRRIRADPSRKTRRATFEKLAAEWFENRSKTSGGKKP